MNSQINLQIQNYLAAVWFQLLKLHNVLLIVVLHWIKPNMFFIFGLLVKWTSFYFFLKATKTFWFWGFAVILKVVGKNELFRSINSGLKYVLLCFLAFYTKNNCFHFKLYTLCYHIVNLPASHGRLTRQHSTHIVTTHWHKHHCKLIKSLDFGHRL